MLNRLYFQTKPALLAAVFFAGTFAFASEQATYSILPAKPSPTPTLSAQKGNAAKTAAAIKSAVAANPSPVATPPAVTRALLPPLAVKMAPPPAASASQNPVPGYVESPPASASVGNVADAGKSAVAIKPAEVLESTNNAIQEVIDLSDVSINDAFRYLAFQAGINYLDPPAPGKDSNEGTVSLRFHHITPLAALKHLAELRGYRLVTRDGITTLTRPDLNLPSLISVKKFPLRYVDAKWMLPDIANLLGVDVKTPSEIIKSYAQPSEKNISSNLGAASGSVAGGGSGGGLPQSGRWTSGLPMDNPLSKGGFRGEQNGHSGSHSTTAIFEDRRENAIVVRGTQEELEMVENYIAQSDKPEPQIMIQACVVEIDLDLNDQHGVDWSKTFGTGVGAKIDYSVSDASVNLAKITQFFDIGKAMTAPATATLNLSATEMQAVFRSFATSKRSTVMSAPTVLTRSGVPVSIRSSTTNPVLLRQAAIFANGASTSGSNNNNYDNTSTGAGGDSIQSFPTGILLDVMPRLLADGVIDLNISPKISRKIGESEQPDTSGNGTIRPIPIISENGLTTTTSVRSGMTVVIGGLIDNDDENTTDGILPGEKTTLLGHLIGGSRTKAVKKKNLVIFVTPTLVYPDQILSAYNLPEDNARINAFKAQGEGIRLESAPKAEIAPPAPSKPKTNRKN